MTTGAGLNPCIAAFEPGLGPCGAITESTWRETSGRGRDALRQGMGAERFAKPRRRGLGPVYNETSCVACHGLGAPGGAGPESKNVVLITVVRRRLRRAHVAGGDPPRLPRLAIRRAASLCDRSGICVVAEAILRIQSQRRRRMPRPRVAATTRSNAGSRRCKEQTDPDRRLRDRAGGTRSMNGFNVSVSERNTPPLFGAGLIDEIPSEVLVADGGASSRPSVRGRVSRTKEGRIGRFGWKAQVPSLHEFVRGACANELGLEVPGHSQGASPLAPGETCASGLDLTEPECDDLVAYVRALPAPVAVDPSGPQGTKDMRAGRRLFAQVGCASCHVPTLGDVQGIYSDLLLHDMGQSLSDSGSTYGVERSGHADGPTPREWRTPPLWGYRDSGPYMHDGRAQNLEEAVALHDGQAQGVGASVLPAHVEGAGAGRGVSEIAGRTDRAGGTGGRRSTAELSTRSTRKREPPPRHWCGRQRKRRRRETRSRFREAQRKQRAQKAAKRASAADSAGAIARKDGQDHRCNRLLPGDRSRGLRHQGGPAGRVANQRAHQAEAGVALKVATVEDPACRCGNIKLASQLDDSGGPGALLLVVSDKCRLAELRQ